MENYKRFTDKNISYNGYVNGEYIRALKKLENMIENDCLIEMPCVRKISSPLGKYEAVYINERDLTQQCLVSSKNEGWLIIEKYGCDKHSSIAKERLKENNNET